MTPGCLADCASALFPTGSALRRHGTKTPHEDLS
ncbi:hypothetical protein FG93_04521 [Bosea sp. LC85]|nr:hypothetical protein FG93_04521 [Bosea sp. LC85]